MRFNNPFADLSKFELLLWLASMAVILGAFLLAGAQEPLNLISSLLGVTSLIFISKGYVFGEVLTVFFAVLYGIVSYFFHYYGEMITFMGMTGPVALFSIFAWLRYPYADSREVEVSRLSRRQIVWLALLAVLVTLAFYFILGALGNANLLVSTVSVTASFVAASLAFLRSPYYAVVYAVNDLILIVLWALATLESVAYLPMTACFVTFFFNDLYGFYNWRRMQRRQSNAAVCGAAMLPE